MNLCYRFIFHIFICFVLLFTLLPSANAKDVTLQLKWKHQFQFAGFYAAQKQGYYAEEGLTVTINPADGSQTATDVVLSDQAEFGISDSSLALSRLKGQPVVVVATIFQHSPLGLITLKSSEILSPLELKGKSVMYQKNIDDAVITAMLAESGLADSGFKHIKHNFDDLALLGDIAVDAMSAYLTDQPFLYREKGIDINIISPSNYGIDFYGDLLFVKESYLKSNPAEVEAFRRASLKGWKYALEHQEEMVDWILTNLSPEKSREHLLFEAQETAKMIRPDLIELGHFSISRMLRIADTYKALGWANENSSLDGIGYTQHLNTSSQGMFAAKVLGLIIVIMSSLILAFWLINKKLKAEVHKQTESLRAQSNYLQKIKDRLDYAQSIARLGNWEWSCEDDNWWWSNELKILLGLPTQTAPSLQLYLNFVHPDDRETVESSLNKALTSQQDYHLQYRIISAPGDVIDVEEKVEVILNNSGETESFFGIVLDVTERKKEAERISESEKLYRQMFDNNTAIKLLIDAESGYILRANDAACSFYGYSHDEFLEMKVFEINAHTPDEIQDEMTLALEEDRRFYRFKHKLANGETRDVEVHSGPVEIDSKKRLFSIIVDVTARNRYESELITKTAELDKEKLKLRESEQMYKTLFEGVSIGIVMQNSMGEITALNETASSILQASREELLNKSSFDPSWEAINENGISVSGENHPLLHSAQEWPNKTAYWALNTRTEHFG
ncbi:ABC transporter substrate-binding protein [Neptuniibacter sp.]|uniref:ABC transporter substrate-binding protein n=1 Tax=Neptuniibacter sp. TaxID=1962643 RepID=UPI00261B7141|nr:ABC transporter substrate-binding protein [Neptuniibacter sp.]MCP4598164.1 ABC transporter substrate-binding protein [Neptuniibacter sp.]